MGCTALSYTDFQPHPAVSYMDYHANHVRLTRMYFIPLHSKPYSEPWSWKYKQYHIVQSRILRVLRLLQDKLEECQNTHIIVGNILNITISCYFIHVLFFSHSCFHFILQYFSWRRKIKLLKQSCIKLINLNWIHNFKDHLT